MQALVKSLGLLPSSTQATAELAHLAKKLHSQQPLGW